MSWEQRLAYVTMLAVCSVTAYNVSVYTHTVPPPPPAVEAPPLGPNFGVDWSKIGAGKCGPGCRCCSKRGVGDQK